MQYSALAALAAVAPLVSAYSVTIVNNCDFPVYVWSVGDSVGQMVTLDQANPSWTQAYFTRANGGGPCIKASSRNDLWTGGPIAQIEYKWDSVAKNLWYDLSNINGLPFNGSPMSLVTSDPSCPSVSCDASGRCNNAYYKPDDNLATLSCGPASITFSVCTPGSAPADSDTGSSYPVSSASPTSYEADASGLALLQQSATAAPAVVTQYEAKVVTEVITKTVAAVAAPSGHPHALYIDDKGHVHDKSKRGHVHRHIQRRHIHA